MRAELLKNFQEVKHMLGKAELQLYATNSAASSAQRFEAGDRGSHPLHPSGALCEACTGASRGAYCTDMAFARCFNTSPSGFLASAGRSRRGRKGAARAEFVPLAHILNPPKQLPISDPVTGWTAQSKRTGLFAIKYGMYSDFSNATFEPMPLTVLKIPENVVTQVKTVEKEGYTALQLAAGDISHRRLTKPLAGHLQKAGIGARAKIGEFRVTPDAILPVGTRLGPQHFVPGQYVDVAGVTKGRGFQGVMKRWGFGGLPASHGVSLAHRSLGATGARQDPGKVWKGKKMPGHMGGKMRWQRNLLVWRVDPPNQCIVVRGSVPGGDGTWIRVMDAAWKPFETPPPFPTYFGPPGKAQEAQLPLPFPLDPNVDTSLLRADLAQFYEEPPAIDEKAMYKEKLAKGGKGARARQAKLEKRLIASGRMAPPGAKQTGAKKPGGGAKKKAEL